MYRFDEVVFDLPEGRQDETVETITAAFTDWWEYGYSDQETEVTLEDRMTALEDMFLMTMMEG